MLESVDMEQMQKKLEGVDFNIDPESIQKLFQSFDPKQAQKAMEILNSDSVKKSLSNISKHKEGFTSNIEGMVDYSALDTIINNFDLKKMTKPKREIIVDPTTTISDRLEASKVHISNAGENIDALSKRLTTKIKVNSTLDMVKGFFDTETQEIKDSYKENLKKKKINKRLVEFYDRDATTKKNMIVYLKYIYYLFITLFVITIFYKNRYKDKKLYGVLLLLFIIPNFAISNLYKIGINAVGHTKLDLLYTFMITITTILIIALFFIFKFALKNAGGDITELLNVAKVTSSIKNSVKSMKNKVEKKNITGEQPSSAAAKTNADTSALSKTESNVGENSAAQENKQQ